MTGSSYLLYAEDPGAANFVTGVAENLIQQKKNVRLIAEGAAVDHIANQGLSFEAPDLEVLSAQICGRLFDAVIVGTSENSNSLGLKLIDLAKACRVPSIGVVDGPASTEHRFRGISNCPLNHAPDKVLVPDDPTRLSYLACGFDADRVVVVGHPLWDRVRDARQELRRRRSAEWRAEFFPKAPSDRPLVLFLADLSTGLDPAQYRAGPDYSLRGRGKSDLRTDIVLEELLDAAALLDPSPAIALRLHPKSDSSTFDRFSGEVCGFSQGGSAFGPLLAADLVVGMTTILLVEAALLGCPTLSVIPRKQERDWLPTIPAGITRAVHERDALREELPASFGRFPDQELLDRSFPSGAAARCVQEIERLIP